MCPPIMVDLLLYFLQMGAADGEDRPVLKNCRPVLNLHYVYQIKLKPRSIKRNY